jgi:regulatory subunit for Cdc7p protein kinase
MDHFKYVARPRSHFTPLISFLLELDNILSRLIPSGSKPSKAKTNQRSPLLTQLLQHERLHGTTSERDPRERRHDFQYFSKGSYFLLVEDICGELAPIAIMEYPAPVRSAEKNKSLAYPILYMDPRARSPFVKFDETEARKLEKAEANEKLKEVETERRRVKVKEFLKHQYEETQKKAKTLRRCASMGELGIRATTRSNFQNIDPSTAGNDTGIDGAGEILDHQQVASGFGPSTTGFGTGNGYIAASGNSVAITSTTTTSFARTLGSNRLPPTLRERLGRQVITSRRLEGANGRENTNPFESHLRKAKSTTTMRLPAREESKKPGYCEACRVKFGDFAEVCTYSSLSCLSGLNIPH